MVGGWWWLNGGGRGWVVLLGVFLSHCACGSTFPRGLFPGGLLLIVVGGWWWVGGSGGGCGWLVS